MELVAASITTRVSTGGFAVDGDNVEGLFPALGSAYHVKPRYRHEYV